MAWYGKSSGSYGQSRSSSNTVSRSVTDSQSDTTQGTALGAGTIQELLGTLMSNLGNAFSGTQFTKEAATVDSQEAMNAAINTAIETGIGGVNQGILNTGAYSNTTRALLADNLTANAAAEGSRVRQQAITDYAGLNQANQSMALQALFSTLGLDQSQVSGTTARSETNASSRTNSKSSSWNLASEGGWK